MYKNPYLRIHLKSVLTLLVSVLIVYVLFIALFRSTSMVCAPRHCLGTWSYGVQLFYGFLYFSLIGYLIFRYLDRENEYSIFTYAALGVLCIAIYVYLRSFLSENLNFNGVSAYEFYVILFLLAFFVLYKDRVFLRGIDKVRIESTIVQLFLILFACLLVANREMPREFMLSSDPDSHAFFANQILKFGGVPVHQREWGAESFNYPAASAVVIYIWHLISSVDIRSLVTPLPVLFTIIAALIVPDALIKRSHSLQQRILLYFVSLGLCLALWFYPNYPSFYHMEGYGRQIGILFSSLLILLFFRIGRLGFKNNGYFVLIYLAILFLTLLNPSNIVFPSSVLFGLFLYHIFSGQFRVYPLVILLSATVSLLIDPYYQGIFVNFGSSSAGSIQYPVWFNEKSFDRIVGDFMYSLANDKNQRLFEFAVLLFEKKIPLFMLFSLSFLAALELLSFTKRITISVYIGVLGGFVALFLVYTFSQSLVDDRRFYLLGPYVFFSLSHYKGIVLSFLLTWIFVKLIEKRLKMWALGVVALGSIVLAQSISHEQLPINPNPRVHHCGGLGCVAVEDKRLLERLQNEWRYNVRLSNSDRIPRVLIPNVVSQRGREKWIFPTGSSRIFPFYEIAPAAFYYYQGTTEYSTESYLANVCETFNKQWLHDMGIYYVYLPSQRDGICIHGLEEIIAESEVIAKEGTAMFLELGL